MFANLQEATTYTITNLKTLVPDEIFDDTLIAGMLEELFFAQVHMDEVLSTEQRAVIEENKTNQQFIDQYLAQHIPNYYTAWDEAVQKVLMPYIDAEQIMESL